MKFIFNLIKILFVLCLLLIIIIPIYPNFFLDLLWFQSINKLNVYLEILKFKLFLGIIIFLLSGFFLYMKLRTLKLFSFKMNLIISILIGIACSIYCLINWKLFLSISLTLRSNYKVPLLNIEAYQFMTLLPVLEIILFFCFIINIVFFLLNFFKKPPIVEDNSIKFSFYQAFLFTKTILFGYLYKIIILLKLFIDQPDSKLGIDYFVFYGKILSEVVFYGIVFVILFILIIKSLSKIRIKTIIMTSVIIFVLYLLIIYFYPYSLKQYYFIPNEFILQTQFIKMRLESVKNAYNLKFKEVDFKKYDDYKKEISNKIKNVRLWDYDSYYSVIKQIKSYKTYFDFHDIDFDVYEFENNKEEVMVSVREFNLNNLSEDAKKWDNLHLRYTHGYGIVMSRTSVVDKEGMPEFILGELELTNTTNSEFYIEYPQIYFGELTSNYIIINTKTEEFDYMDITNRKTSKHRENIGVSIGNYLLKMIFSFGFKDQNLFFSEYIETNSRIVYNRLVSAIPEKIMPLLIYSKDPYIAIIKGRLKWIIDCYTYSDKFPLSEMTLLYGKKINYIRNSAKVVIDAYSGEIKYYIVDKNDPFIINLKNKFPSLFEEELDKEIEKHLHYPVELFNIQAELIKRYHTENLENFYNSEEEWEIAKEVYGTERIIFNPYYILNELIINDQEKKLMCLSLPFTPKTRDNLAAWIMGYYLENEGNTLSIIYPYEKPYSYGPLQVEAKINQDNELAKLFTLWGQKGAKVFRGSIKYIPIWKNGKLSLLYVEPLFLASVENSIPQLVLVVSFYSDKIYFGNNLDELISKILYDNN